MKTNPAAIRECLQGDCNVILKETLYAFESETHEYKALCDIDVDAVLSAPLKRLNYGRVAKPKAHVTIPRRPQMQGAGGFIGAFLSK
jgi:hypothetical protein